MISIDVRLCSCARQIGLSEREVLKPGGGIMSDKLNRPEAASAAAPLVKGPRMISSQDLFGGDLSGSDKVVIIRHGRNEYRLRITATGKLILTK